MNLPLSLHFPITSTWDGHPLPKDSHSSLHLSLGEEMLFFAVDAPFWGDPSPPGPPASFEGLWSFEVVEIFLAGPPGPSASLPYLEIEMGPHGHFLVLQLSGVRQARRRGFPLDLRCHPLFGASALSPRFSPNPPGDERRSPPQDAAPRPRWSASARLPSCFLPFAPSQLQGCNAYAIHGPASDRAYHAAFPLPGHRPDFHQPSRFPPPSYFLDPHASASCVTLAMS